MGYKLINNPNYEGKKFCKNCKVSICFYTKKQMKMLYPNKNYRVVGEINNKTGIHCDIVEDLDCNFLPVFKEKTYNMLTESTVGYVAVDTNIYLAVIKNVLLERILIISILVGVTALIWFFLLYFF